MSIIFLYNRLQLKDYLIFRFDTHSAQMILC